MRVGEEGFWGNKGQRRVDVDSACKESVLGARHKRGEGGNGGGI